MLSIRSSTPSSQQARSFILPMGLAGAIVFVIATALLTSLHLRKLAEARTAVTTQNLARSIEQTIEGMVDIINIILQTSADEISRQSSEGGIDRQAIIEFLARQVQREPDISYLRATNEHGDIIYGSGTTSPAINIADREYFQRLRDTPNADILVNRTLVGRIAGKQAWLFARRINKSDGSFGGVIFAGVLTDQIEHVFSQFQLDSGGSIALRDANMGVIARYASTQKNILPLGDTRLSQPFILALERNPQEGTYISGATSVDGTPRVRIVVAPIESTNRGR